MRVLMPLPLHDYDPSEAAITWSVLTEAGVDVVFATPTGEIASADPLMLTGEGFDVWACFKPLARIKFIGLFLRADARARAAHARMCVSERFRTPRTYDTLDAREFDGLVIPGGHAQGMKPFLEDIRLQNTVKAFFDANKPVGAICHGALLVARSRDLGTGRSVLFGRKTTSLTWALEKKAWDVTRYLGRFWDRDYYRTYRESANEPIGYWSVESEIKRHLRDPSDYCDVPPNAPHHFRKASGLFRDTPSDDRCAFVVVDGNYVSARWPGDAFGFARAVLNLLRA